MSRWGNFFVVIALGCTSVISNFVETPPKVTLPNDGSLVGTYMTSLNGRPIRAFRGIPYAEPPILSLRFKAPIPKMPWTGELLADKDGSSCMSMNPFMPVLEVTGSEDCLYLNTYAPPVTPNQKLLPVMVFITGGAFVTGNSNSAIQGPQRLLDHDVILVTGNYRNGALGFLSTGTEDCPGNQGLKDQALMLEWVKANIEAFGGDPNDVTIFGESAGGASIGLHIYSPLSKGLFHKAIMQSGSSFDPWAVVDINVVRNRTRVIAETLGCPVCGASWKVILTCLRVMPAEAILSTYKKIYIYDKEPTVPFPPVVERDHEGAFLPKHPKDYDIPPSAHVPMMLGITSGEGILKSEPILDYIKDDFTAKFYDVLPIYLFYDHFPISTQKKITQLIDEFYFKGVHDWSGENPWNLTKMFTDELFLWGQDRFLRHRFAAAEKSLVGPTYYYLYDHQGPEPEWFPPRPENYGVAHGEEVPYLFYAKLYDLQGDENDDKMKWALPYMWTNFAKTGNPTPNGTELPSWIPATGFPLQYAHIGRQTSKNWTLLSNELGLYEDRVGFWRYIEKNYWQYSQKHPTRRFKKTKRY